MKQYTKHRLCLVRHGDTPATEAKQVCGRLDVPLSSAGHAAIARLVPQLARELPEVADISWHCSPLTRTVLSCQDLMSCLNPNEQPMHDVRLMELDFGDWEGMSWDQVYRDHGPAMQHWAEDWVTRAPPGGESFAAQSLRCQAWLRELMAALPAEDGSATVAVTHGGSIRALVCHLLGWPLSRAMTFAVDPASLFCFDIEPPGRPLARGRAVLLNQTG